MSDNALPTPEQRARWRTLAEKGKTFGFRCGETEYLPLLAEAVLAMAGQLDDYEESTRLVMQERCGDDRLHCTCVPALRAEIAALTRDKDAASRAITELETEYMLRVAEIAALRKALRAADGVATMATIVSGGMKPLSYTDMFWGIAKERVPPLDDALAAYDAARAEVPEEQP